MSDQSKDQPKDEPQDDSPAGEDLPVQADVPSPAESEAEFEAESDSESAEKPAASETPAPTPDADSARRQTSWAGLIGLLIALLAAAGVAYLWNEQQAQRITNEQLAELQRTFSTQGTTRSVELSRITGDIEHLIAEDQKLDDLLVSLTGRIERQLEELPARMTRIEGTLDKIPGVDELARSAWVLAEAEYFLRIANAQLNLAGNVDVALRALELADAKIKDLVDPGLTRVRAKISDERTALKAVPRPDAEGIVLELGSLALVLHTLPLARSSPDHFTAENGATTETGWRRAWRVIVDALSSIISVRRNEEAITPLMSATEESMLIRSLDIELQIARLALIRNEGGLYRQSLQSVEDRLTQYFDNDSQQVQAAQATVNKLANASLPETLPDISGSLSLLLDLGDEAASP